MLLFRKGGVLIPTLLSFFTVAGSFRYSLVIEVCTPTCLFTWTYLWPGSHIYVNEPASGLCKYLLNVFDRHIHVSYFGATDSPVLVFW